MHATDFSPESLPAFAHALRLALDAKAKLYLLHIEGRGGNAHWSRFPHVRDLLGQWGLIDPAKPPEAIVAELGLHVAKVSLQANDPRTAIAAFANEHQCDLLVLSTYGGAGWLRDSIAEDVARRAIAPTLFLPGDAPGFIEAASGRVSLSRVLVPIDDAFDPLSALRVIETYLRNIAPRAGVVFLHVGDQALELRDESGARLNLPMLVRRGGVVDTILAVAAEYGAKMIAMPTQGRHGLFDALRGSTTERVLRAASLPLLAAPVVRA